MPPRSDRVAVVIRWLRETCTRNVLDDCCALDGTLPKFGVRRDNKMRAFFALWLQAERLELAVPPLVDFDEVRPTKFSVIVVDVVAVHTL